MWLTPDTGTVCTHDTQCTGVAVVAPVNDALEDTREDGEHDELADTAHEEGDVGKAVSLEHVAFLELVLAEVV